MSGAIGKQQIKKLDSLIEGRRKNAEYFVDKISKFKSLTIQKETGKSSWFGFSVIVSKYASYNREMLIKSLQSNGIEYRPIVTGNFLKNKSILKYYDYEISGDMSGAELIEENGLFLGNHHYDLSSQIDLVNLLYIYADCCFQKFVSRIFALTLSASLDFHQTFKVLAFI